jgi:hypothetical protein
MIRKFYLLSLMILAVGITIPAHANIILLNLDSAIMSGAPGDTLTFFGEIVNTTSQDISLDFPTLFQVGGTLPGDFTYNLDFGWPDTVAANSTSGSVDLFSVDIPSPQAAGPYDGTLEVDGNDGNGNPYVATADFSVVVTPTIATPEPTELLPCMLAVFGVAVVLRQRKSAPFDRQR